MKSLYNYILESKDDNLHEFIQYIINHGKQGVLKSNIKDIEEWVYLLSENPKCSDEFDNIIEHQISDYIQKFGDKSKDEDYYKNGNIGFDEAREYYANYIVDKVLKSLTINKNNCIYAERCLRLPKFSNKDQLYKWFSKEYSGRLGEYWCYEKDRAYPYNGIGKPGETIVIKGYIQVEGVDWNSTFCTNLLIPREKELTLNFDYPIQITEISTYNGNHKIFNGNLILKV